VQNRSTVYFWSTSNQ